MPPRSYRNYAEFEREYIRPAFRVGQSVEEMVEDSPFEAEYDFDRDPYDDKTEEDEDEDGSTKT